MTRLQRLVSTVALAALVGGPVAGCGSRIPLPPANATPGLVLDAYLRALVARDCETAAALAAGGGAEWCGAVTSYAPPQQFRAENGQVSFMTTLVISGGDGSLPDGPNLWSYTLGRGTDGRWRITDEGMG